MWLEIFKTGKHTDSKGRSRPYPPETLDLIAAQYNSRILEQPSMAAPVVKGHPQTDSPAFGWVERLARRGEKLMALVRDIQPDFGKEVRDGRFSKISVSLYPDLMLKHVGFLGAAAPAVTGLNPASFSEEDESIIYGSNFVASDSTDASALDNENATLRRELELLKKEIRLREFRDFADSLVANDSGSVFSPAQTDMIVDLLEMANRDTSDGSSFTNSDERINELKNFFRAIRPIYTNGEFSSRASADLNHHSEFEGVKVSDSRIEIHEKARNLQASQPGLSYEEAVLLIQKNDNNF